MSDLKNWIAAKISSSPHASLVIDPPPAVAGGGDAVLAAVGPGPDKVVYLGTRHGGTTIRVGFAAKDRWANEEIEDAVESNGGTMTEFLEDEMEADDKLEFPVQHFHEAGWFHFACDISQPEAWLASEEGRELLWFYFDGYARAVLPIVMGKKKG